MVLTEGDRISLTDSFRIRSRDDFEALFRAHYSMLCSYANGFLKDADASEEVVQEVMLKIWVNRRETEIAGPVKSYLFRAVRNGCMNVIKHLNVRGQYASGTRREEESLARSGEDEMIAGELEERIRLAIDNLPMERKKIFVMSRYEGLTYSRIAEKLNLSEKTVENQMGRALKTLREELKDYLPWIVLFFNNLLR